MARRALSSTRRKFNRRSKTIRRNRTKASRTFSITIDEGKQFTLRRLEFTGNTFTRDNVLRREVLINEGDIYNQNILRVFDHRV